MLTLVPLQFTLMDSMAAPSGTPLTLSTRRPPVGPWLLGSRPPRRHSLMKPAAVDTARKSLHTSMCSTWPCCSSYTRVCLTTPASVHTSTMDAPALNTLSRWMAIMALEVPALNEAMGTYPLGPTSCTSATREFHTSRCLSVASAPVICMFTCRLAGCRDPSTASTMTRSADTCTTLLPSRTLSCSRTFLHTLAPSEPSAPSSRICGPHAICDKRPMTLTPAIVDHASSGLGSSCPGLVAGGTPRYRNMVTWPSFCPHASTAVLELKDRHVMRRVVGSPLSLAGGGGDRA
mmetsp:Transcript_13037/g.31477  ORF Transcript_13037/g.31477 Transcript_13037/m.31477 type:complete len:290 (+) Transcript_13037:191-1060(+)